MGSGALQLVKIPLRADRVIAEARRRGIPLRDVDDGYLAHCLLRELWQEKAPAPFALQAQGRCLDVWGYGRFDASELVAHARQAGDPALVAVVDELSGIATRTVPQLRAGARVAFTVRACPVVRLASAKAGHRAGAELDAFLARCLSVERDMPVSRATVYIDWLTRRLGRTEVTGVTLTRVAVRAMAREHLVRRTQGTMRVARRLDRPDVTYEGELTVVDGATLLAYLERGVGRHRAFGFGALLLTPTQARHEV